ncbi:MAG: UvrD-helicase domain-containing protein [Lachnospiraceae bacterium]|nr:UvrD-helicase domain-containing protein [Lachnospiraceae bacterium]
MNKILENLNSEQEKAVRQAEGPLLILAGAGSGKTRVITNRAAYMIGEEGINPWNILAITFTNKAAGEMRTRIDKMVGYGSESIWVSTFHSMCVRILRRHADLIGYDTGFTIYDADDQKAVMKDVCKRLNIDTRMTPERKYIWAISHAKDELISVDDMAKDAFFDPEKADTARVYREYQKVLHKNNAFDFDDLIVKTVELFRENKEVLDNYQERFRYIMVDEYQDTNTAQFELVRLLADKYRNICVVGDDDQSIYKFRGANIRNILDFEKHYPDAVVIKLEENYRSTQNILDAANAVISNNTGRKDKSLWTGKGEGEKIRLRQLENAYDEADFIVNDIKKNRADSDIDYRDTAVLYRTNAQSRILEEKMIMAGIPYNVVGGVNFYARREIKDILSYLKVIDNARDDLAVKRIINVPRRGIGAATISKIETFAAANDLSFYEALKRAGNYISGKTVSKLDEFKDLIEGFRMRSQELSLEELTDQILEETDYVENMEAADEYDAKARIENIEELINKTISFDEEYEGENRLSAFLQEVALVADIDSVSEDDDKVLLMTLHGAKGLEFPSVYMTGMEEGLFPGYMSVNSDDESELEEERRLCYVGITRAKEHLTMTVARSRMVRGETRYNAPSRFIKEIPVRLFDLSPRFPGIRESDIPSAESLGENKAVFRKKPYASTGLSQKNASPSKKPFMLSDKAMVKGAELNRGTDYALDYTVGDRVSHVKFGVGTVTDIKSGGRDYEVTVEFDRAGVKKMFAAFAKLKKTE